MRLQVYGRFDIHRLAGYLINWHDECNRWALNHTGLEAVPVIVTGVDVARYNDSGMFVRYKTT